MKHTWSLISELRIWWSGEVENLNLPDAKAGRFNWRPQVCHLIQAEFPQLEDTKDLVDTHRESLLSTTKPMAVPLNSNDAFSILTTHRTQCSTKELVKLQVLTGAVHQFECEQILNSQSRFPGCR
jgi:hypothetical protein